ncbi:MAG: rane protein [Gammaproteobacteria bacterium]|jgi:transporter family protein|nr:rane protein [Gammaproteobacteria bacterium]
MTWLLYALVSAVAAAATAILAKIGVGTIPSNLATAIRTSFILPLVWGLVAARGEFGALKTASTQTLVFLALSAVATGISWLAYFKALQMAPASHVAPIDKLSLPLTITLAAVVLGEPMSPKLIFGVLLMVGGAILTLG